MVAILVASAVHNGKVYNLNSEVKKPEYLPISDKDIKGVINGLERKKGHQVMIHGITFDNNFLVNQNIPKIPKNRRLKTPSEY